MPACLGEDLLAQPVVSGFAIVSLQLAFLMTCHRAVKRLQGALLRDRDDVLLDMVCGCCRCGVAARTVAMCAVLAVAVLAVGVQLAVNISWSPLLTQATDDN